MSSTADTLSNNHAQLMDGVYRGQRHIYDLTRKYYLLGRDRLIRELDVPHGATVLEIGCGTGRNLTLIGRYWLDCRLFGLDISEEMLKSARESLGREKLSERVELEIGDAANFDAHTLFGRARFDRIIFSYTLSMIPDWHGALEQAAKLLSNQGSIHVVDFGKQEGLPGFWRKLLSGWLAAFHVERREHLKEQLYEVAAKHDLEVDFDSIYKGYAAMAKLSKKSA